MAPRCAKMASKRPHIGAPTPPKTSKSDGGLFVFRLSLFFQRSRPRSQKSRQEAPPKGVKLAILRLKFAILAPSWRQVGHLSAILPPTWPILAPRWAPRASQKGLLLEAFCEYRGRPQKNTKKVPKRSEKPLKNTPKMKPNL